MRLREWLKRSRGCERRERADIQLARILDEQERTLRSLDLPLPELKEPVRMTAVGLRMPLFNLTRHPFFPVQAKARDYVGYLLLCERSDSRRALDLLEEDGLHQVVRRFPGVWLNRDPYLVHRTLNRYAIYGDGFSLNADLLEWLPIRPLRMVKGFTVSEVFDRITWRGRFFSGVVNKFPVAVDNNEMPGAYCNDALQLAATIPPRALLDRRGLAEDLLAFRVPPVVRMSQLCDYFPDRSSPSAAVALLEAMRAAGGCFGLEISAAQGRMEFRFLCTARRWAFTRERVASCFQSPAIGDPVDSPSPSPLHLMAIYPASPFVRCWIPNGPTLLRTLKTAVESWCCIQILCAPLSLDFAPLLRQELAHIRFLDLSTSPNLDEFARRPPAWQLAIRVFGVERAVVEQIRETWHTHGPSGVWRTSDTEVRKDFDRRLEAWEVMGSEELAELLRLPPLETSGGPESPLTPP